MRRAGGDGPDGRVSGGPSWDEPGDGGTDLTAQDSLERAAQRALARLAAEPGGAVVVAGQGQGSEAALGDRRSTPHVVAPGRSTRMAVGAGATLGGRAAVVECASVDDMRTAPWDTAGPLVALTASLEVAQAAWELGVPVAAPAWPADVEPLLVAAAGRGRVCVHLHGRPVAAAPPLALEQPSLLAPRTVTHGDAGRFAAAGPLVASLLEAAWFLARRGRPITVQQQTCLDGADLDPRTAADHVRWDLGDRWEAVPVPSSDPRELEQVLAALLGERG